MDAEQGLQYLRARWYAPGMGRFATLEPIEPFGARVPNLYSYSANEPVNQTDPTGLMPRPDSLIRGIMVAGQWILENTMGTIVHKEICFHFMETGLGRTCELSISDTYGREPGSFDDGAVLAAEAAGDALSDIPDLIDHGTGEVYEIKHKGSYDRGARELKEYIERLNKLRSPEKKAFVPGTSYVPLTPVPIWAAMNVYADVSPARAGVIEWELSDETIKRYGRATVYGATQAFMTYFMMQAAMAGSLASHGVAR